MSDLHFEHVQWTNALRFYKDELGIFRNRLEEVVSRNNGHDFSAKAEQFQNNFILQNEKVDVLVHDIKMHEQELSDYAKDYPIASDHVFFENHDGLEERMNSFVDLYKDLKGDFNRFLTEWM
jgi:hypothetical protein